MENKELTEVKFNRVKHFCNAGDLVASMAAIKAYSAICKNKVIVCQQKDVLASYYPGATHPVLDENGSQVCMNQKIYDMIRPLILAQDYIEDMELYTGQKVQLDLDTMRGTTFVNMPNGTIQGWAMLAYPNLAYDISKSWITVPAENEEIRKKVEGKIILNFTERYRNNIINYFFLKKYEEHLIFTGTEKEHFLFCHAWDVNIPRLVVDNFLETAYALKYSRFLMSNQSFCWNLASALSTPRILEMCNYAPNCQPFCGEKSYGFFHQVGVEYYFDLLINQ